MKKIHINENNFNRTIKKLLYEENWANSDRPYFCDPDTGFVICGSDEDYDACPFGYFPYKYKSDDLALFTGYDCDCYDGCLHGDIIRSIIYNIVSEVKYDIIMPYEDEIMASLRQLNNEELFNSDGFGDILRNIFANLGIAYVPTDEFVDFVKSTIKTNLSDYLENGGLFEDVFERIEDYCYDYGDDDNAYYGKIFDVDDTDILYSGRLLGRVWTETKLFSFYPGQQPSGDEMKTLLNDLSDKINVGYNELCDYYIIFETGGKNGYTGTGYKRDITAKVQCCKVFEYIEGKYKGFDKAAEEEMTKNRKGVENLNIHLANQMKKKDFFKNFIKTRDNAVYAPKEKIAGSLAAYHAMRYPYGESRKPKRVNILESKMGLLTEGITDVTYHYCSIDSLYGILKDGKIKLTMSSNKADAYHKRKLFYLSTQRSKSVRLGYARNSKNTCRVELDGYQLKADGYEGMPIDYWGGSMGKQSDIGLDSPRIKVQYGDRKLDSQEDKEAVLKSQGTSSNFEFEDRIFSSTPSIPLKYIKRVDCLVKNIAPIDKAILSLANENDISVFFYNSEKDFILQTDNTINQEILMSEENFENEPEQIDKTGYKERHSIHIIAKLCSILCFFDKLNDETNEKVMNVLKKFGLEAFYERVIELLPENILWADESCFSVADEIRKLNTDRFTSSNLSDNIMLLAQYVLRVYGVNNFISLKRYFDENKNGNKKKDNIIQDSVKCVMHSYSYNWDDNNWDVYEGEKKFWEWFDKNQFYDEISRQLDDDEWNQQYGEAPVITHKSKNNESFKKYIQHIMHNDNLSLYDGALILTKIYNNNWEKMGEAFGRIVKPLDINRENFFDYEFKIILSERVDIENKLFRNSEDFWNCRQEKNT